MKTIARDTIYTNVALLPDGDVWWEGKDGSPPKECLDWKGNRWTPESKEKAAPLYQCSPNPAFEDAGQLLTHAVQALLDSPDARFETLYLWVRTFGHWGTIVEAPLAQSLGEFFHGRSKLDL